MDSRQLSQSYHHWPLAPLATRCWRIVASWKNDYAAR